MKKRNNFHSLLERQIQKHLPDRSKEPAVDIQEANLSFFQAVSQAYEEFDSDLKLLQRALELSGKELFEANQEMRVQNSELQAIYKIATLLHDYEPVESVCPKVLQEIAQLTGGSSAAIELYDRCNQTFRLVAHLGIASFEKWEQVELPISQTPSKLVLETGDQFVLINQTEPKDRMDRGLNGNGPWTDLEIGTFLTFPLRTCNGVIGALSLVHPKSGKSTPNMINWLIAVARQISSAFERQHLSEIARRQQANMVAESKMSELGKMAGGIAHEINTPLGAIMLYTEILLGQAQKKDQQEFSPSLNLIMNTTERISKVIMGLRTFSRDGAGDNFEPVQISKLIEDTLVLCKEKFHQHSIEIKVEISDDIEVKCRQTQVSQVLLNLLNNSYDSIASLEQKWIFLQVKEVGSQVEISVTDSGPGIKKEIREKLFRPFFTTKDVGKGTGLGLSISKGIINDHSGHLVLDPNCGNTRFVITLPKEPASPKSSIKAA